MIQLLLKIMGMSHSVIMLDTITLCFKTPNLPENVATTTLLGLVINCQAPVFSMSGQDFHFYCLHQQPQNVRQEPPVLQGSNLEMMDRGLLDGLPDILDS